MLNTIYNKDFLESNFFIFTFHIFYILKKVIDGPLNQQHTSDIIKTWDFKLDWGN